MATWVYIGSDELNPLLSFDDDDILSITTNTTCDLISDELSIDSAEISVKYFDNANKLRGLEWSTPIYIYHGPSYGERVLNGLFYFTEVKRTGTEMYTISATSAIGLLSYDTFYGGVYRGEKFKTVIEDIILTNGFRHSGFSRKIKRGAYNPRYQNNGTTPSRFNATTFCLQNTEIGAMSKRTVAKFKLNKCMLNDFATDPLANETSFRIGLLGMVADAASEASQSTVVMRYVLDSYGIFMDISRASTSDPWPDYGEVFFMYGNTKYSLGTPTEPTEYTIDINPSAQTATINGNSYAIQTILLEDPMWGYCFYGGGTVLHIDEVLGQPIFAYSIVLYCSVDYEQYQIYTYDGELIADVVGFENAKTGLMSLVNVAENHYSDLGGQGMNWAEPDPDDFRKFYTGKAYWKQIGSDIEYGTGIDDLKVSGWIDVCSKRDALQQLLFSQGIVIQKTDTGGLKFIAPDASSATAISSDNIYVGGDEQKLEKTNAVTVVEHSYVYDQNRDPEVVYENAAGASQELYIAVFTKKPVYGIPVAYDGMTLYDSMCNAAIVSGAGKIGGIPYIHSENVIEREIGNFADGRTIDANGTMVTMQTSDTLLDRMEAYYGSAKRIKNSILVTDEKCSKYYSFKNPFNENAAGFLSKMSSVFSTVLKSNCDFISNYTPPEIGNGYSNYAILTGTGTWTVPASVFEKERPRIRVVLIGGGSGGASGYAGANGEATQKDSSSNPAPGGYGGEPGEGGKVYEFTIENPEASYSYSTGTGGAGGAVSTSHDTNNKGTAGTETTLTGANRTYTSDSGASLVDGYQNFFTGDIYATGFKLGNFMNPLYLDDNGNMFGQGGRGGFVTVITGTGVLLTDADSITVSYVGSWSGGARGNPYPTSGTMRASGGLGGGAGVGSAGGNGSNARYSSSKYIAGNGGVGGDATWVPPKATTYDSKYYGYGGHGGGGGGGGGSSGYLTSAYSSTVGTGGAGGSGGVGGEGGDGCVLIYY